MQTNVQVVLGCGCLTANVNLYPTTRGSGVLVLLSAFEIEAFHRKTCCRDIC